MEDGLKKLRVWRRSWSLEDELEELGAWRTAAKVWSLELGGQLPKFGAWSRSETHAGPR